MRIGVVGARSRTDSHPVYAVLDLFVQRGDTIISGGAVGVDMMVAEYARARGLEFVEHLPQGDEFHKNPYLERNTKIAEDCEILIAFPAKDSHGTWDTITKAKALNKRIVIFKEG
jgi:hypothetical protein